MKILDRYLATAVITGTLITLAALLPLLGIFILADEMDNMGTNAYGFSTALLYVTLSLPRFAYQLFPIATLIGALVGLGLLASRSELVAMRAAGVSIGRIVQGALAGGLVLAIAAVLVGEGLAPLTDQRAKTLRSNAQSGQELQATQHGFWARDDNTFINVREVLPDARLQDIVIFELDGARLISTTRAHEAHYENDHWILSDISRSQIGNDSARAQYLAQDQWQSLIDPALLKVIVADPHSLPIWGLWRYLRFLRDSEQDSGRYQVAFWSKLVHPILVLAMIFVSIPVLLGSARSTGLGIKIFAGILIGIVFYLVNRTFTYLALLYGLNPALAAFIPPALFVLVALRLLRRVG
ncbi:LPS export ABC transporter permease LptG [Thiorhodovibrio frisius]|uniref:Putative permease n=1 Tax=Thiorhodovibrio frisius TaxID=631362 RepID=H8Z3K3_9GAMM|nr:LPS export ABC transporter permease LptG [Thiorhodovibrio frisius]EIC21911.1 putative permease [Thiorhodovibrio frisius]WPL24200.1 Lipopolysaccharide export system permease protein LptG [Thiorhodovibrio frisius]